MKPIFILSILYVCCIICSTLIAQQVQYSDPNPNSSPVINSISFTVDRYYPFFGNSDKPLANDYGVKLIDQDNKYSAFLYFRNQVNYPLFEKNKNILRFYFPETYYLYMMRGLGEHGSAIVTYREFKDGHNWGEIYFDKYP